MKFKTPSGRIKGNIFKNSLIISIDKKGMMINKSALPIKLTAPSGFVERKRFEKQAERDLKTYRNKDIFEPLFYESLNQSMANPTNGGQVPWVCMDMYWSGYARGIREHRQKVKESAQSAFDIIGVDDVTELSHELGVSEHKLTYAVMEVISKRKNGGTP